MKGWEHTLNLIGRKKKINHIGKWSSRGGGMSKHRTSGTSKHKKLVIIRSREYNRALEAEAKLKEERKSKMFESIKQLFN